MKSIKLENQINLLKHTHTGLMDMFMDVPELQYENIVCGGLGSEEGDVIQSEQRLIVLALLSLQGTLRVLSCR